MEVGIRGPLRVHDALDLGLIRESDDDATVDSADRTRKHDPERRYIELEREVIAVLRLRLCEEPAGTCTPTAVTAIITVQECLPTAPYGHPESAV